MGRLTLAKPPPHTPQGEPEPYPGHLDYISVRQINQGHRPEGTSGSGFRAGIEKGELPSRAAPRFHIHARESLSCPEPTPITPPQRHTRFFDGGGSPTAHLSAAIRSSLSDREPFRPFLVLPFWARRILHQRTTGPHIAITTSYGRPLASPPGIVAPCHTLR